MKQQTVFYSYIIYSQSLDMKYIGSSTNIVSHPTKLLTQYKTSSHLVKYYINLFGLSYFNIIEINEFKTQQETLDHEKYLIDLYDAVSNPKFLNISRQHETFNVSGLIWANNGIKEFYLPKDAILSDGIIKGRLPRKTPYKKINNKKNMG